MPKAKRDIHVFAMREFGYDDETGVLDRGQVIELKGHRNDQKLLTLRFLAPCTPGQDLVECGVCGRLFVDDHARQVHGDRRHKFRCECGKEPPYDHVNPADWLARHRARCGTAQAARQAERKTQREAIAEQPGRKD